MKTKEVWKDVKNYDGFYQVSNLGRVRSFKRDEVRILKVNINSVGYPVINLSYYGKKITKPIHVLMAVEFLGHLNNDRNIVVDHIDNDKLNNNLINLQIITIRENNSKDRKNGSSKYTGVYWHKSAKKWVASISIKKKNKHLGYYLNELEASNAYEIELNNLQ